MGDPIEAGAIQAGFGGYRTKEDPLYVGTLKTNIGHLEGVAGIAALLKVLLVLERGVILPNIWFEKSNPKIPLDRWSIQFPLEATAWPDDGLRRASISAFGYGGSNAHVIVDDALHYLEAYNIPRKDWLPIVVNA